MADNIDDILQFYTDNIEFSEGELSKAEFVNQNFDPSKSSGRFVQGYASTPAWDSDGESIVKSGLDISYYNQQGFLNFMHSNKPEAIIGIPVYSKIDHVGFFTKGMLFKNNKMADDLWNLALELKSMGNPRRLGFSIEGKVVARSAINKAKIVKAKVTNVAVTHIPVNTEATFEAVSKSFVPPAYDEIVSYIMKDLSLKKDLAAIANVGAVAGHSWGSSNYNDTAGGHEALRVEDLEGAGTNAIKNNAVVGNKQSSEDELEARLSSAYRSAHKSHTDLITLLKTVHPRASDVLLEEIVSLVRRAEGIDNFVRIINDSSVLR